MKSTVKLVFFLLLLYVGAFQALAQKSLTSSDNYFLFKNYTMRDGLIDNVIWSMAQDRNGYIWIGSEMGLTRFDGKLFFHKAIPEIYDNSAFVQYIDTMPGGNIVSTSSMQGVFVQQDNGKFKRYLRTGYVELGKNIFNSLKYCPDSSILVSTSRILSRISGDSIKQIYDYGSDTGFFYTLDLDKDNRIWFGGRLGLGILQRSGTEYEPVFLPEFKNQYIVKILFDDDGTLHVATSQGYYRIKWQQDKSYMIEQPFDEIKDNFINHIYLDKARHLWISTAAYGSFRTNGNDIMLHLTKENGLISSSVYCVMQDREDNYWFGTDNGVSMIENFDNYAIAQNGIRFIDVDGMKSDIYNRIWIWSASQLHLFQEGKLIPINLSETPFEKTGIYLLDLFNSELIISSDLGLYKMLITKAIPDLRKVRKIVDYPTNNIAYRRSHHVDSSGIWICTQNKVFNYDNERLLPVTFNHPDSTTRRPAKMMQDKYGYYWFGDFTYGLYRGTLSRPDNNTLLFDNITAFKSLKADSAFVTAWIQDMCFDKAGNLWFSTLYTGVYKLEIDSSGVVSDKLYSTANGLLSNNVSSIDCDDEGRIWLSTQKGINILQYDSAGVESLYKLDINEGIEGRVISPLQMDGRLYLLTEEGIFITQNQPFKDKPDNAIKVVITNLLINGVVNPEFSAQSNHLRLAHEQKNLTIEFSAIAFKNANDVRYQHKLEGADKDWSVLSDRSFVDYASLRPGRYTFKVRAVMVGTGKGKMGEAGEIGEMGEVEEMQETSLSFRITPPYYQTIWFYVLIALAVSTLLYTYIKFRMRHAIKMERMRVRIASDLHDDIGSTLSSISLISEMASRKDNESELAKALSKIGNDSRDVLNSMDDIIWSVNPQNDSLSSLTVRLREYAIPVCESKNITFDMNMDETIHSMKLEMDERRNIYLIVKEAINNAVKYSGCTLLSVSFTINYKQLEIKVCDNGCGFDPTRRGVRNGITNMERRAKQTGIEFTIHSEKNKGAQIQLKTKNLSTHPTRI